MPTLPRLQAWEPAHSTQSLKSCASRADQTSRWPGERPAPREARDLHDCVEWAGTQPWSNGKVGICGISYYAMNQWQVAPLQPPHLAAICAWEGSSDYYRELCRHGGILSDFLSTWYPRQVTAVQYGVQPLNPYSAIPGAAPAGRRQGSRTRRC